MSGYTPPTTPEGYEPRYKVGDLIRDALGKTLEIHTIHRAHLHDGISSVDAINSGFTTYQLCPPGENPDVRGSKDVLTTSFLHHMIDTGWGQCAYLGPKSEAVDPEGGAAA